MQDDSLESLGSVFGWRVTVQQLCLEAEAYKYTRLLKLIKLRQSSSASSSFQNTFDFSRLPLELFDNIIDIVRRTVILETKSRYPYKVPELCACVAADDKEDMVEIATNLVKSYPEFQDSHYFGTVPCHLLWKELGLQGQISCILSVLDTTFEGCQWGWTAHWTRICHNLGMPSSKIAKEVEPVLGAVVLLLRETGHKISTFEAPPIFFDTFHEKIKVCNESMCTFSPEQYALSTVRFEGYSIDFHEAWEGPIPAWLREKYNHSALLPLICEAQYLLRPIPDTCQGDMLASLLQRMSSLVEDAHNSTSGYWKVVYF